MRLSQCGHALRISARFLRRSILMGASAMKTNRTILLVAGLLTIACVSASAQQITGVPGSPEIDNDDHWQTIAAARSEIRWGD